MVNDFRFQEGWMGIDVQEYISQQNFEILKKNHPEVLSQLSAPDVSPVGEVVSGAGERLNLKITVNRKTLFLHPQENPEADQNDFLSNIPENFSGTEVIFGMGLGYGVKAILEQRQDIRYLVIIEAEPGILLQALRHMDLTGLLRDPRVILGIDPADPAVFMAAAGKAIAFEDTQTLTHPVIFQLFPEKYKPVQDRMFAHINRYNIAGATKMAFGRKIVGNRFGHLKSLGHYFRFESLIDQFKDIPAYIAAGGPSLEANIGFLKQVQDRAVIICVDSVLPVFLEKGIAPDFVTCIDYQDITYEKFSHKINEIPDSIALLSYTSTTPAVQKNFPGTRKFFLFAEDGMDQWVNTLIKGNYFSASGPSVANLNFIAAKAMGCSPIIFVGQDLCYHLNQSHTKDVVLTAQDWTEKHLETGRDLSWIKGVEGDNVPATRDLVNIRSFFESLIRHNPGEYINCSTGGAHIEGTRYMPLARAVDLYYSDTMIKFRTIDAICSPENKIGSAIIASRLNKDLQVIEQILILIRKVGGVLDQGRDELPRIRRNWKKNSVLPRKIKGLLTDIDTLNSRIDSHGWVWKMVEDMTAKALQKSEQMAFEAGKLQGILKKYPDWLEKTIDRLIYINTVRMETLDFLAQGIKEVISHITEETRLLNQDPGDMEMVRNLARLYVASEDYSLARPFIEKYYALKKESAQVNFFMGCLEGQLRRIDRMESYFMEASRIDPALEIQVNGCRSSLGDHYFTAALEFQKYDSKVSQNLLLKGLRICPFHEKLQILLKEGADQDIKLIHEADAKGALQDQEKRVQNWIQTIHEFSQARSCLSGEHLGLFCFFCGKIKFRSEQKIEALALFERSIAYLPKDAGLLLRIADLFLCAFEYDEGLIYLNKAIELDAGCTTYWEGFGDFLFQHHKFDEAISAYEQSLQYFPTKSETQEKIVQCWLQKGNAFHGNKDFMAAEAAYKMGLDISTEKSPSLLPLYNNLGSALQNRKEFASALSAYDRALDIDPHYAEALYNKGLLLESMGETEKAARFLFKARKLSSLP